MELTYSQAFKKLDANKNGYIELSDIKLFYNAKGHPKVISGDKTEVRPKMSYGEVVTIDRTKFCRNSWTISTKSRRMELSHLQNSRTTTMESVCPSTETITSNR